MITYIVKIHPASLVITNQCAWNKTPEEHQGSLLCVVKALSRDITCLFHESVFCHSILLVFEVYSESLRLIQVCKNYLVTMFRSSSKQYSGPCSLETSSFVIAESSMFKTSTLSNNDFEILSASIEFLLIVPAFV